MTTGRTATYKLRATPSREKYCFVSNGSEPSLEVMKLASLLRMQQSPKNWAKYTNAQYFFTEGISGLPAADLKRRQMAGNIAGVKRRPGKGPDGIRSADGLALLP